jgi:putative addiction module component (TIGR02574 family)
MSDRAANLLAEALKLTEDERAELAEGLLESLDGPPPSDIDRMSDDEFAAELERRHQEFLSDPSVGIPWEEVKRKSADPR